MRLEHTVHVPAPVEDVWKFLDDIHGVASCMPGAELTEEVDASTFNGVVKISVGPLTMNYTGQVQIVERAESQHHLTLTASGRDRRGSGTARADVNVQLTPDDRATTMSVVSDVQLTGRIASLGRGVQDVSNKLFAEFADRLAQQLDHSREPVSTAEAASARTDRSGPAAPQVAPAPVRAPQQAGNAGSSIKLTSMVWSVTRERLADLLQRLSERIRP